MLQDSHKDESSEGAARNRYAQWETRVGNSADKKIPEMIERLEDAADIAWLKARAPQETSLPSIRRGACRSTNALGDVSRHCRAFC